MAKKKKLNNGVKNSTVIIILLVVIGLLTLVILRIFSVKYARSPNASNSKPTPTTNSSFSFFNPITPTVIPVNNSDKKIFIHPLKHFSFEYPGYWNLTIEQHIKNKDWYEVLLSNKNGESRFKIYFQVNGRDYPWYEEQTEFKTLGNKSVKWTTLYNDGKAVEAFTSFPNNDFGDKLIGLYIYLPKENQEEFIKQVEEIVASLK